MGEEKVGTAMQVRGKRDGMGREWKGREGKGMEGNVREGKEGKGREWEGNGRQHEIHVLKS